VRSMTSEGVKALFSHMKDLTLLTSHR
jgi:hypothetical protein